MTVCYNKTAIQTVWSCGGTSDSVVIEWWTPRLKWTTSSSPLVTLCSGFKADVQIWVTFPKEFDEIVAKLHFIVLVQRSPSLPRDNQITSVSRLKTPSRLEAWKSTTSRLKLFRLPLWSRFDMDLDEKVADLHFPALVAELTDLTQVTSLVHHGLNDFSPSCRPLSAQKCAD